MIPQYRIKIETTAYTKWKDIKEKIKAPVYKGWTFDGWSLIDYNGTRIDENYVFMRDTTIFACYLRNVVKITLDVAPGTSEVPFLNVEQYTDHATVLKKLQSVRIVNIGYGLDYWSFEKGGKAIDGKYQYTENTTICANWSEKNLTIMLDPNGGELPEHNRVTIRAGQEFKDIKHLLPAVSKFKYKFLHWSLNTGDEDGDGIQETVAEAVEDDYIFNVNTILYAQWEYVPSELQHTFTYPDGYVETVELLEGKTVGDAIALLDGHDVSGYTLKGWANRRDSSEPITDMSTKLDVTARFFAVYDVTFDLRIRNDAPNAVQCPDPFLGKYTMPGTGRLTDCLSDSSVTAALSSAAKFIDSQLYDSGGNAIRAQQPKPGTYYIKLTTGEGNAGTANLSVQIFNSLWDGMGLEFEDFLDNDYKSTLEAINVTVKNPATIADLKSVLEDAIRNYSSYLQFKEPDAEPWLPTGFFSNFELIGFILNEQIEETIPQPPDDEGKPRPPIIKQHMPTDYVDFSSASGSVKDASGTVWVVGRYTGTLTIQGTVGSSSFTNAIYPVFTFNVVERYAENSSGTRNKGLYFLESGPVTSTTKPSECERAPQQDFEDNGSSFAVMPTGSNIVSHFLLDFGEPTGGKA